MTKVKFLGIYIDQHIKFVENIKCIADKLSSACYALRYMVELVDFKTIKIIYFAYFHAIMSFNIEVWGNAVGNTVIMKLQKKRAIRIITGDKKFSSCRRKFVTLGILTFVNEYIYRVLIFLHNNQNLYTRNKEVHTYFTRGLNKLRPLKHTTAQFEKGIHHSGRILYNTLPEKIALERNIKKYKNSIKMTLLAHPFYSLKEFFEVIAEEGIEFWKYIDETNSK